MPNRQLKFAQLCAIWYNFELTFAQFCFESGWADLCVFRICQNHWYNTLLYRLFVWYNERFQ